MKATRNILFLGIVALLSHSVLLASEKSKDKFPVYGFSIALPKSERLDEFIAFIEKELVPRQINTLVLQVGYNYRYTSHPELRNPKTLSKDEIKKLVSVCQNHHIRIIPTLDLLGHQSWGKGLNNLLRAYPQFDESPGEKIPDMKLLPNSDGLFCKSYCPLHPDLHKIVLDLIDELCDVFESDAFHAGMDEVYYIGDEECPRCKGKDRASLFAGEANLIRDHLAIKNRELWIWGDRLIDGKSTGLGMWEASMNDTYRAIDLIKKDIVICDWHYDKPVHTAEYFAQNGFRVVSCSWRNPVDATTQVQNIIKLKTTLSAKMSSRYLGIMQTIWISNSDFLDEFYRKGEKENSSKYNDSESFRILYQNLKQ